MGSARNREELLNCTMSECSFHSAGNGCRMAQGIRPQEAVALMHAGSGLDQQHCSLMTTLLSAFSSSQLGPGASRQDSLGRLYILLQHLATAANEERIGLGYILKSIARAKIDEQRRSDGRARCGSCRAYGWNSRRCLARDTPHIQELRPDTEPGRLTPACLSYQSIRASAAEEALNGKAAAKSSTNAVRLMRALRILERTNMRAAALLTEHYFEGRSLRSLEAMAGVDRRTLAREMRAAEYELGALLEDLP